MTPYEQMGGADGILRLVTRFYDLMDSAPEAVHVRAVHARDLTRAREKLRMYLTGWLGGPPEYEQKYGHPRLRARHFPFTIGVRERDGWTWCMDRALDEHEMPSELREVLRIRFHQLADHMRNQPE